MQEQSKIIDCYDKSAENYAAKYFTELEHKNLDRVLLKAFVAQNKSKGKLIDLGCGPGQTTKFIHDSGLTNVLGTDLSDEMVNVAAQLNPHIQFEQADMLDLKYTDNSFGSAIAFYAIVNFDYAQIKKAFTEVKRVLIEKGEFLFSFHIGDEIIHVDTFLDKDVDIKFQFFKVERIKEILTELDFEIIDIISRQPYSAEHPTERAYIWARK